METENAGTSQEFLCVWKPLSRAHLKLTLCRPVQRFVCVYTRVCMAKANGNFPLTVMAERGMSLALIILNPPKRRATSAPRCREAKSHIAARFCVVQRCYNSLAERARDDFFRVRLDCEAGARPDILHNISQEDAVPCRHRGNLSAL